MDQGTAAQRAGGPRPAAVVILLRDGGGGLEVLLVRRNPLQRFMGGAWVFPGGAVNPGEPHASAAVRELAEEAGVDLGPAATLVPFSRWVTPPELATRFDAHFFVAPAPPDAIPQPDGAECVAARWLRPREVLDAHARGEMLLFGPTVRHLERLAKLGSVAEALALGRTARGRAVTPSGEARHAPSVELDQVGDDQGHDP